MFWPDTELTPAIPFKSLAISLLSVLACACSDSSGASCAVDQAYEPVVRQISSRGSARATAYGMSNKLLYQNGRLYFTWLDHLSEVMIGSVAMGERDFGQFHSIAIGRGTDNHGGAALVADDRGHFHVVYGAHHGPLKHRVSARPGDIERWLGTRKVGTHATYPSVVATGGGRLAMAFRSSANPAWELRFGTFSPSTGWAAPKTIVAAGGKGYSNFGNHLAVSPEGRLFLAFHLAEPGPWRPRSAHLISSDDNGRSWKAMDGIPVGIPVLQGGRRQPDSSLRTRQPG